MAAVDGPPWDVFLIQGVLAASMMGLWGAGLVLLIRNWSAAKGRLIDAVNLSAFLVAWGIAVAVIYRRGPTPLWLGLGLNFGLHAFLVPVVWPVAHLWLDSAHRYARGAWIGFGAVVTAGAAGALTLAVFAVVAAAGVTFKIPDNLMEMEQFLTRSMPGFLLIVTGAAVYEELVFRLGFFVFLHRALMKVDRHGIIAAVVSSALWAFAHVGSIEPAWIKYAQIFPFGLLQCALLRLTGRIGAPILAHALFNVGVVAAMSLLKPT